MEGYEKFESTTGNYWEMYRDYQENGIHEVVAPVKNQALLLYLGLLEDMKTSNFEKAMKFPLTWKALIQRKF